jgi:hypothetical protein
MRSKMWESGRKQRLTSAVLRVMTFRHASAFCEMLAWESMVPLGSPVVPEV